MLDMGVCYKRIEARERVPSSEADKIRPNLRARALLLVAVGRDGWSCLQLRIWRCAAEWIRHCMMWTLGIAARSGWRNRRSKRSAGVPTCTAAARAIARRCNKTALQRGRIKRGMRGLIS